VIALEDHLRARRTEGRKILAPFVTGGLGSQWLDVVRACIDNGADAIEVGIPFSDPMMDGVTIQEASQRALELGATPEGVVRALADLDAPVPIVAMTYYNPVHHMGHERWAQLCADNGIAGTIIPDLPFDEGADWIAAADAQGLANVLLVAPSTTDARLREIVARSRGFVYTVSRMGVTGERANVDASTTSTTARVRAATDLPVLVGFGISTSEQARTVGGEADGVIVASALMRRVLDGAQVSEIGEVVAEFRAALDH